VIQLEERREVWIGGVGCCGLCGAVWPGVCHAERQFGLQCPSCGAQSGTVVDVEAVVEEGLEEAHGDRLVATEVVWGLPP
jgi:hypothetical protein